MEEFDPIVFAELLRAVLDAEEPLAWRRVAPDGTVMSEDDDWGRLAHALAAKPYETGGYVIYP